MKKGRRVDLTEKQITAWAESLAGVPVSDIADKHGVSRKTIWEWIKDVKEQVGSVDIDEMRGCLFSLFPDAVSAIKHCLTFNRDGQIALRLLSGLAVLSDKQQIEYTDKANQQASSEIKREIIDIVADQAQKQTEAAEQPTGTDE